MPPLEYDWSEHALADEPAAELLSKLGYRYVDYAVLDAERESQREALLPKRLRAAIRKLNPWISAENITRILHQLRTVEAETTGLIEANEQVHRWLVDGMTVRQDLGRGEQSQTVRLIDFNDPANNELLFTRQFYVEGIHKAAQLDLAVFVNGLPLVLFEDKGPTTTNALERGVGDFHRYQELDPSERYYGAPALFHAAQILIVAFQQGARYGTVGTPLRAWAEWKDPYPLSLDQLQELVGRIPTPQDVLIAGVLTPANLLDLMQNFFVFETERGQRVKKLARYPQYRAVGKTLERIHNPRRGKRGGVIWHTQGSGKTLTMVFAGLKLRRDPLLQNPTIVLVTDRTDLDRQLTGVFKRAGFPNPEQAESTSHLRQLLMAGPGRTILTTIHKFWEVLQGEEPLNDSDKLVVMVDEAHRTQYKTMAGRMRAALPNAAYLAFTGTPIDKKSRSTLKTFGDYLDKYTIRHAESDGAVVPILYEMREDGTHVVGQIDALFDRYFPDLTEEQREELRQEARSQLLGEAPQRIRAIALDLVEHYEALILLRGFKAQVVAISRKAAVQYAAAIQPLLQGDTELAVIMSADLKKDSEDLKRWHRSKEQQDELIRRFKDPDDPLRILIVCDMLITGFDAPVEQVMYLDAPLREHTLLQAVARVNRPADGKDHGLIVDYWGIGHELQDALNIFDKADVDGVLHPLEDEELPRLDARHRAVMGFFSDVDRRDLDRCVLLFGEEDRRLEFERQFRQFAQSMDRVMLEPAARKYDADLQWLGKFREALRNRYRDNKHGLDDLRPRVRQLITEHLQAGEIVTLLEPVSILAPEFEESLARLGNDEARASEMEHALRHEITLHMDENPVFYRSLRERLEQIISDRRQARIDAAEQLRLLREGVAEPLQHLHERAAAFGDVAGHDYAFFELISAGVARTGETEEQFTKRKTLAQEIRTELEGMTVVDWLRKEDVQRQMRQSVKRQLRAAGYSDEEVEPLTLKIIDLARVRMPR